MRFVDISPLISEKMAVYPGDVPFARNISMSFKKGDHLTLSSITSTLHLGAHADSSNHYHADGEGIEKRNLNCYFGLVQVITVQIEKNERIHPKDFSAEIKAERVLFKTSSFPNSEKWNSDYNSLSPELIEYLHSKKVILIGIDTPSVDPDDSKNLESHQALFKNSIAVLEGLNLKSAKDGVYVLSAFPLAIADADASPVRAVLIDDGKLVEALKR